MIEAGIEPDIVCGTSIGSLVGAAYVGGTLGELRQWAEAATWRDIVGLMDVKIKFHYANEMAITSAVAISLRFARWSP